jgi:hypothetical protein
MQRYDILQEGGGCCPLPELENCEWGEWVKWSDVASSDFLALQALYIEKLNEVRMAKEALAKATERAKKQAEKSGGEAQ